MHADVIFLNCNHSVLVLLLLLYTCSIVEARLIVPWCVGVFKSVVDKYLEYDVSSQKVFRHHFLCGDLVMIFADYFC